MPVREVAKEMLAHLHFGVRILKLIRGHGVKEGASAGEEGVKTESQISAKRWRT